MTGNRNESHFVSVIFIFWNIIEVLPGLSDLRTLAYSISFQSLKSYLADFLRKIAHFCAGLELKWKNQCGAVRIIVSVPALSGSTQERRVIEESAY